MGVLKMSFGQPKRVSRMLVYHFGKEELFFDVVRPNPLGNSVGTRLSSRGASEDPDFRIGKHKHIGHFLRTCQLLL